MSMTLRRTALSCGFALTLAAAAAGCGSSNSNSGSTGTSVTAQAPASASASASVPASGPEADIAKAFTEFFSGSVSGDKKIALVQNGQAFAPVINAQSGSQMAGSTTASVSRVQLVDPTHANVTYSVNAGGKPVLPDQSGQAVQENGTWKVSAATFCALLAMEQNTPAACTPQGAGH